MSAATVAAIAKAAVAVLSNEKTRKALGWVIVAILSPLIVLVVLICAVRPCPRRTTCAPWEFFVPGGVQFPPALLQSTEAISKI